MITMNAIQWPKKWIPGETDNFVSNEVIVMSTIAPLESLSLEKTAQKHQVTYLEAPVSGSLGAAKAGVLLILAAGNEQVITQLKPVLAHLGSQIFYLGKIG